MMIPQLIHQAGMMNTTIFFQYESAFNANWSEWIGVASEMNKKTSFRDRSLFMGRVGGGDVGLRT